MVLKYVKEIKEGKILAVDWRDIQEMLGENMSRKIKCSICEDDKEFPPEAKETFEVSEEEVVDIIKQAGIRWVSFDFINGTPLSRFRTRYFAVSKPQAGQWFEDPRF